MLEQGTEAKPRSTPSSYAAPKQASSDPEVSLADLTASADHALQSVGQLYNTVDAALQRRVQENPYTTLGVAAGVGFVLGGGLASPMGQMLLRVSMRAFGPPLFNALLQNALERANLAPQAGQR